jgi:hypothetical protein
MVFGVAWLSYSSDQIRQIRGPESNPNNLKDN